MGEGAQTPASKLEAEEARLREAATAEPVDAFAIAVSHLPSGPFLLIEDSSARATPHPPHKYPGSVARGPKMPPTPSR